MVISDYLNVKSCKNEKISKEKPDPLLPLMGIHVPIKAWFDGNQMHGVDARTAALSRSASIRATELLLMNEARPAQLQCAQ